MAMNAYMKILLYIVVVLWCVILLILYKNPSSGVPTEPFTVRTNTKYVLYWTSYWGQPHYYIGFGHEPFKGCQFKNCYATNDRTVVPLEKFDAIIFHFDTYDEFKDKKPRIRSPHQRYILLGKEPPVHDASNISRFNYFFNWTMTFRFDSNIKFRYGYIRARRGNYSLPSEEFVMQKKKLAAWFVSHCNTDSERDKLVKEIQRFMNVDIYGNCRTFSCGGTIAEMEECYYMVERDYKFYFSFENSFCKDYTTDKLYNLLMLNVVPVVYGFGDYKLIAPPNSVINVADFESAEQLVNYLKALAADPQRYLKYFEWKQWYEIDTSDVPAACELCQKLNEAHPRSIYEDLYKWWWGQNGSFCTVKKNLPKIVRDLLENV